MGEVRMGTSQRKEKDWFVIRFKSERIYGDLVVLRSGWTGHRF